MHYYYYLLTKTFPSVSLWFQENHWEDRSDGVRRFRICQSSADVLGGLCVTSRVGLPPFRRPLRHQFARRHGGATLLARSPTADVLSAAQIILRLGREVKTGVHLLNPRVTITLSVTSEQLEECSVKRLVSTCLRWRTDYITLTCGSFLTTFLCAESCM